MFLADYFVNCCEIFPPSPPPHFLPYPFSPPMKENITHVLPWEKTLGRLCDPWVSTYFVARCSKSVLWMILPHAIFNDHPASFLYVCLCLSYVILSSRHDTLQRLSSHITMGLPLTLFFLKIYFTITKQNKVHSTVFNERLQISAICFPTFNNVIKNQHHTIPGKYIDTIRVILLLTNIKATATRALKTT